MSHIRLSLSRSNLAKVNDGFLPSALWAYYLGYQDYMITTNQRKIRGLSDVQWKHAMHHDLPRGLRLVHSFIRFDGDILNGGFCQYLGNHTRRGDPEDVYEDLSVLRTIGAAESAELLQQAIDIVRRDYRWPSWEDIPDEVVQPEDNPELERLDELRCNDESSCRDYKILDAYLRQHLDECEMALEVACSDWRLEGAWNP